MMNLTEAALATGGVPSDGSIVFAQVSTDSRRINPGDLFIALVGEHFDGHEFVKDLIVGGAAAAAVVNRQWAARYGQGLPLLAVEDTRLALGHLGAYWRDRFDIPLIGVTGSNGKTTVKEMCASILRAHYGADAVLATTGNLNNDIGLPLTLLGLKPEHRAAVIEMGMNHAGELSYLTRLASPGVALVNNAQRAHLEGLGSLAGIAAAKGEIFQGLRPDGIAVINVDDPHAMIWRDLAAGHRVLGFGLAPGADVTAHVTQDYFSSRLKLETPAGECEFDLPLAGLHNVRNALAAAAATLAANIPLTAIARGLAEYRGVKGRLQKKPGVHGALIIDDSYNANPDSMRAAVDVLAALPGKRILVIGDMGEVGAAGGQFHDELGGYAKSMGVDLLFCLGELSIAASHNFGEGGFHMTRVDELVRALRAEMNETTTVLVKGSRFMRMERVVDAIVSHGEHTNAA